ncbi:MAG: DnaA/Hda family protein [Lysobacterales bacterium]
MSQMPLALGGLGTPDFDSFWAGNDGLLLARLRALADSPGSSQVLLGGARSSGKTHLLMACCDAARAAGHSAVYLPLARLQLSSPGEPLDAELVAIDDVGLALGERTLAEWLFAEINRQHDRQRALLLALGSESDVTASVLPDLASRLARSEMLRIERHDDEARKDILMHRAGHAGMPLDEAAADYLLRHHSRDLRTLLQTLANLDREALARSRRITVPLLKEVLS